MEKSRTIHDLFRSPDIAAQETLKNADKVVNALRDGALDNHDIVIKTGLGAKEVARSLHYLQKDIKPTFIQRVEIIDRLTKQTEIKFFLTEDCRRAMPPVTIDWNSSKVDPRKKEVASKPKNKVFSAMKHIHGMVGKVRVLSNGEVCVGGLKGKVHECIKEHGPISSARISELTGIKKQQVWNYCGELEKFGFISFRLENNHRLYFAKDKPIKTPISDSGIPIQGKPDIPGLVASVKELLQEPNVSYLQKAEDTSEGIPPDSLVETIKGLLKKYEGNDIILTTLAEQEEELNTLRKFRKETEAMIKNINLDRR